MKSIFEANTCIDFLKEELEKRIRQNNRYSLRAFARDLKLSPGALSDLLNENRPITKKAARKISQCLGFSRLEQETFENLAVSPKKEKTRNKEDSDTESIDLEYFKAIENWYHFAILNLLDTKNFDGSIKSIAMRLNISFIEAKLAVDRLINLGLVKFKADKVSATKSSLVNTPSDIPSKSIKHYHRQMLEKAILSLDEQSIQERDISGIGFALDPKLIKSFKKDLSEFQDYLIEKYSDGNRTEVYQLEFALFKLTK